MSEANPPETPTTSYPAPAPEPATPPPSASTRPPVTPRPLGQPEVPNVKLSVPLQQGEQVIMFRRKHWMYLAPILILNLILGLAPILLLAKFLDLIGVSGGSITAIIYVLWFAMFAIRAAVSYYRYMNDTWVITNQRVIDTRRKHPFDLQVSTADLVNIQEMTINRSGIFKTMLDYGDIVCETAGSDHNDFTITGVPHPREVQALVDKERDRERMRGR
uniref:DUF304 domain-containing protein n=1 Tax=uncultured bacterium 5G4 TaxID=1701326 RepID=A0A166H3I4_9BACT|nr:hypothetical protein 5G4_030 [uncultured bacterium 5G4]